MNEPTWQTDRLIDYLKRYMQNSEKGSDDPMYQMAHDPAGRNKMGDLDYKSISKLYELEDKFDEEYAEHHAPVQRKLM